MCYPWRMGTGDEDPPFDPILAATLAPDATLHGFDLPPRSGERVGSLVVIAGAPADIGTHVLVNDEVVIGRADAALTLRDARISRRHVRVSRDDDRFWVEDLGSTNGCTLNGRPIVGRAPIADADKLYLGSTVVKFALIDETEAAFLTQMTKLAGTDPLTGLHATHKWDGLLEEAVRNAKLTKTSLAVLMMDLDGLKQVNDQHGHRFGAHTIGYVGSELRKLLGGRGEGCRFGGDEFCAYLPGAGSPGALAFAEEVRSHVEQFPTTLDGVELRVTISIGVAARSRPDSPAELTAMADEALYRAKAAGKNCVRE
jgi:two-component system, cell cycle response regulator